MTTPATHLPLPVLFGLGALVAWRLYSRIRRMVGRQKLSRARSWVTVASFSALLLLLGSLAQPAGLIALAAGVVLGVVLSVFGLRLTRFEETPSGLFYTPSAHIGIALSLLFIARVGYRLASVALAPTPTTAPPTTFMSTPLTLALFGLLAGYYVAYAAGLLRWARRVSLPAGITPPDRPIS